MNRIPFVKRHRSKKMESLLLDALNEEWMTSGGVYFRKCEQYLTEQLGCSKAIITPNGFTALYLSMLMLRIAPGDEVLLSSYSCPAALNSVLLCGATPVLCGINDYGAVTHENLRKAYNEKTKAVVINHYGGYASDLDLITDFCRCNDLPLVEDCATSYGSIYKEKKLGTYGDLAIFSFNDKKDLCIGEGGALIINSEEVWISSKHRTTNGIVRMDEGKGKSTPIWIGAGFSNKVSELLCAALYAELLDSDAIIERKREICGIYLNSLSPISQEFHFRCPDITNQVPNGNTFYLLFNNSATRDKIMQHLRKRGIETCAHYGTLSSAIDVYGSIRFVGEDDGSGFNSRMLRLPVYSSLSNDDVQMICDEIKGYFMNGEKRYGQHTAYPTM